jgi:hypothetical protein
MILMRWACAPALENGPMSARNTFTPPRETAMNRMRRFSYAGRTVTPFAKPAGRVVIFRRRIENIYFTGRVVIFL